MPIEARAFNYPSMQNEGDFVQQIADGVNQILRDGAYVGHVAISYPTQGIDRKIGLLLFIDTGPRSDDEFMG